MMLLILTTVLGYELKTAVGTSVFIMTFTALTGAISHFAIGGMPDMTVLILCVVFTLIWARIAAVLANKAQPKTLNRATGIVLVVLGIVVFVFSLINNIESPSRCETMHTHILLTEISIYVISCMISCGTAPCRQGEPECIRFARAYLYRLYQPRTARFASRLGLAGHAS